VDGGDWWLARAVPRQHHPLAFLSSLSRTSGRAGNAARGGLTHASGAAGRHADTAPRQSTLARHGTAALTQK
jgi:hypothetical protein